MKKLLPLVLLFAFACKKDATSPNATLHLAIRQQPDGAVSGQFLTTQPIVEVRDAGGNLVTSGTYQVTATVTGAALFSDGMPVATAAGVVTFTHLRIDVTAPASVLMMFSAPGVSPIASSTIAAK